MAGAVHEKKGSWQGFGSWIKQLRKPANNSEMFLNSANPECPGVCILLKTPGLTSFGFA